MAKALLVIDMQNICVGKNHAKIFNYDKDKQLTYKRSIILKNSIQWFKERNKSPKSKYNASIGTS